MIEGGLSQALQQLYRRLREIELKVALRKSVSQPRQIAIC